MPQNSSSASVNIPTATNAQAGQPHHFYSASPSSMPTSKSLNEDDDEGSVDYYFPGAASLSDHLDSKYQHLNYIYLPYNTK